MHLRTEGHKNSQAADKVSSWLCKDYSIVIRVPIRFEHCFEGVAHVLLQGTVPDLQRKEDRDRNRITNVCKSSVRNQRAFILP